MGTKRIAVKQADQWTGQMVCVVLNDGRYYIGRVEGVQNGELSLAAMGMDGTLPPPLKHADKAQVSGFLGNLLGGMLGGGGNGGGQAAEAEEVAGQETAAQGNGGFMSKLWPTIKMGMGMVRFIWPLVSKFFA